MWQAARSLCLLGGLDSGWWFGTWILCSHILGIIIPIDLTNIFQRGRYTTNQLCSLLCLWRSAKTEKNSSPLFIVHQIYTPYIINVLCYFPLLIRQRASLFRASNGHQKGIAASTASNCCNHWSHRVILHVSGPT